MQLPDGWISPLEQAKLEKIAGSSKRAFLEVGPWLGRSTVIIAKALPHRHFVTVELNPTMEDFVCHDGLVDMIVDNTVVGTCNLRAFEDTIKPHLDGSLLGKLKQNLSTHGVEWVTVIEGDIAKCSFPNQFDAAFIDTAHTEFEFLRTIQAILPFLTPEAHIGIHDANPILLKLSEKYLKNISVAGSMVIGTISSVEPL